MISLFPNAKHTQLICDNSGIPIANRSCNRIIPIFEFQSTARTLNNIVKPIGIGFADDEGQSSTKRAAGYFEQHGIPSWRRKKV